MQMIQVFSSTFEVWDRIESGRPGETGRGNELGFGEGWRGREFGFGEGGGGVSACGGAGMTFRGIAAPSSI